MKKTVGGKIININKNTELITYSSCNMSVDCNSIVVGSFSIKNEDTKDIHIKINYGSEVLLKPNEMLIMSDKELVESCIVLESCNIRWTALI